MRIRIVNPNSTASMTAKAVLAAKRAAAAATEIEAATSASGPVSIEGFFDGALSLPGLLAEIRAGEAAGVDAHVIACFDDTGLDAARALARAPVIGIGEAAYHLATLIAGHFSVVTTLPRSIPVLEHNLLRYGLALRCASVRAAGVAVLELEKPGSPARERISAEIGAALSEDRAEAIVLGCAGMVDLAEQLSAEHGVPVIEGVGAAVKLAESLFGLKLTTSKAGGWATPIAKPYEGALAAFDGVGAHS
jgi:allantoin racemase